MAKNIKIYHDDQLVHDCELCTNPGGQVGWYDHVDQTFHPIDISELEPYLCNAGTQYIDTGFVLAVDVVEVVRCSRCIYGMQGGWVCMLKQNPRTYPDSFCSEGRNAEYEAKEAGDEVCEECMIRQLEKSQHQKIVMEVIKRGR